MILPPHEVVKRRFKDFILDPEDISPSNILMMMKRELFSDAVTYDFKHLPTHEYCLKYCGGCSESKRIQTTQTCERACETIYSLSS